MISESRNTPHNTSRRHEALNALQAILLIVWEMNSRFNIGVRNDRPSFSEEK
jgi:hypothetical protein